MRLFEALTIAFAGQVVLAVAVMGASRPRWMNLLPLVCLAPLAAHFLCEAPRWQMAPVYAVAVAGAAAGVVAWLRGAGTPPAEAKGPRRSLMSRTAGLAGFLLLAASLFLATAFPGR